MTEKQCYTCTNYQFEFIDEYIDEWCSKDNKYFMSNKKCPNWEDNNV